MRAVFLAASVEAVLLALTATALAGGTDDYRQLIIAGHPVKWGEPAIGSGATVTYALADRGMAFGGPTVANAENCAGIKPVDAILARNAVPRAAFERELAAAFANWSAVANLRFMATDPASADIIIGAEATPRGYAFTNLASDAAAPGTSPARIEKAVICLNPDRPWKMGFDGHLDVYDLRYTLTHEIGHALGLDHPDGPGALMYFKYSEQFRAPQAGDIAGIVSLYGSNPLVAATTPAASPAGSQRQAVGETLGLGTRKAE